jgi:hypothetical protein
LCVAPGIEDCFEEIIDIWLDINRPLDNSDFGSNWSQRHVALMLLDWAPLVYRKL